MPRRIFTFLALALTATAATADPAKPTYADDVLPILKAACVNCHGNEKQKGGLNLATFAAAMQGGSSGAVVAPGDPDKSRLFTLSSHKAEPKMPPSGSRLDDGKQVRCVQLVRRNRSSEVSLKGCQVCVERQYG